MSLCYKITRVWFFKSRRYTECLKRRTVFLRWLHSCTPEDRFCTAFKDYRFSLLVSGVLHYLQCTVLDLWWMWSGLSISPGSWPYWLQGITPGHPFWTSGVFPAAALLLWAHPGACLQIAWFCLNENSFDRHHFVLRLTSCSMILCFHLGYSSR